MGSMKLQKSGVFTNYKDITTLTQDESPDFQRIMGLQQTY